MLMINQSMMGIGEAGVAGGFPIAVDFNGTSYLTKSGWFSGSSANGMVLSFWIRLGTSITGTPYFFYMLNAANAFEIIRVQFLNDTTIQIRITSASNVNDYIQFNGVFTTTIVNNWHHVLIQAILPATNTPDLSLYIDDANAIDSISVGGSNVSTIPWGSSGDVSLASANGAGGTTLPDACISEVWLGISGVGGIQNESVRRLFIDASGNPVPLGDNGELPTGSSPLLYLSGELSLWNTNKGTGGGMTVNGGALTLCATSP